MDGTLDEKDVHADPLVQFARWYDDAVATGMELPEALALATATRAGAPSCRMVLLKGWDERGFVFFTNGTSKKAHELVESGRAALTFHWKELQRQVRIEGAASAIAASESDAYFATRPRASQIAAWASRQSETVADRATIDARYQELVERFAAGPVPRPPEWGGWRVAADLYEFWQARESRLHDRLRYTRADGGWRLERLWP